MLACVYTTYTSNGQGKYEQYHQVVGLGEEETHV